MLHVPHLGLNNYSQAKETLNAYFVSFQSIVGISRILEC